MLSVTDYKTLNCEYYLMICVRQVETFPLSHTLHLRHQRASRPLSGCLPSLKTLSRSAIRISPPVLECTVGFLRVYANSTVSRCSYGVMHVLTCASFVAIWSNCEYPHSPSSDAHPPASVVVSLVDAFPESSKWLETSVLARVV
jgi:hypothetical protein